MNNPNVTPNVNLFATSNANNQQNFQQNAAFMQNQNRLAAYAPYAQPRQSASSQNSSHQQPPTYQQHQNRNFQQPPVQRPVQRPPPNAIFNNQQQQQQRLHQQQQRQATPSGLQPRAPQPSNRPIPRKGQVKRMIPPEYEIELARNRRVKRDLYEIPRFNFMDAKSLLENPEVTSSNSKIKNGDIFIATIKGKRCYFKKKIFLVLITNQEWINWMMANQYGSPDPQTVPQWIPLPPSGESIQCELIGTVAPNLA